MRPACQKGSPFRAQAGTTNHIYISRSSTFSERNTFIQLIHPIKGVLGTLSPVSQLIVPAKLLNHRIPSVSRAANSSSVFWKPIQCSHDPSLSRQVGNIVSKFPVLFQAYGRPCFQSMTSCEKVHSSVPMMKDFMPRQRPIHVTRWPNNGTQQPAKHNIHLTQILFVDLSVGSTETSNRSDHGVKIPETVLHCNIPVYQIWSVCKKCFRRSMEVMCQIQTVIASICSA